MLADFIYSAAGSLATLATKSDCMTTVGRRNPHILGMGITPFVFALPNSQALISVEPILDFTHVEKIEDLLHSEVNVEAQPTLEKMLDYYNSPLDPLSPEFLFEHDPFMRKVLELPA